MHKLSKTAPKEITSNFLDLLTTREQDPEFIPSNKMIIEAILPIIQKILDDTEIIIGTPFAADRLAS